MYPFLRLALVAASARRRPPVAFEGVAELPLTCWPWDLDMFAELNNGRVLTLYDLGRFDHGFRSGMAAQLRGRGWGWAVGGASVRYRRRVRAFDRITLRTRPVGRDARWFYVHQAMIVRGEAAPAALFRLCATDARGIVPTDRVAKALGAGDWRPALPDWVEAWIAAEDARVWPPELA
jgi:acyl-CoA thioesterase FadM